MSFNKKQSKIGKGIEALLGAAHLLNTTEQSDRRENTGETNTSSDVMLELEISQLEPGIFQPRSEITQEELVSLADSIRAQGVLQPILARPNGKNQYQIIGGERRWRAAKMAGLKTIPAVIKDVSEETAMAMALIENIQREDLNPLDVARALDRMANDYNLTHDQIATVIGKSRASVTNSLRLLSLSENVKKLLEKKSLDVGHAKVLLSLKNDEQNEAARSIIEKGLSVRETETLVKRMMELVTPRGPISAVTKMDPDVQRLKNTLSEKLGASVNIIQGKNGQGKLVIHYSSLDELQGILAHIQ